MESVSITLTQKCDDTNRVISLCLQNLLPHHQMVQQVGEVMEFNLVTGKVLLELSPL